MRKTFFISLFKNDKVTYENIRKICIGSGDDYKTGCLLDYPYFKDSYKMTAADLKIVSATFLLVCFLHLKETTCETKKNVF